MCDQIYLYTPTEVKELGSVADIEAVGWSVESNDYLYDDMWPDNACLCGVDIKEILNRNNVLWRDNGLGYDAIAVTLTPNGFVSDANNAV